MTEKEILSDALELTRQIYARSRLMKTAGATMASKLIERVEKLLDLLDDTGSGKKEKP